MYFFDLDGTLLDSNGIWLEIDAAFLSRRGVSPVPGDYTEYVTHHSAPDAALYTKQRYHLPESPQQIMDTWSEMARTAYASQLKLKPGVREFLLRCSAAGIRLALLTSCMPHLCRAALGHHGITPLFEAVITTAGTGLEKRDPRLYRLAAGQCGLMPEECTLFDDSPGYCAAAKRAGFQVVGVYDPLFASRQDELRRLCGAGRYLTTFEGLGPELL